METSLARKIILESCPFFSGLEYRNLEEVMCGNEGLSSEKNHRGKIYPPEGKECSQKVRRIVSGVLK
jgi:hypothetical protein